MDNHHRHYLLYSSYLFKVVPDANPGPLSVMAKAILTPLHNGDRQGASDNSRMYCLVSYSSSSACHYQSARKAELHIPRHER